MSLIKFIINFVLISIIIVIDANTLKQYVTLSTRLSTEKM